MRAEREMLGLIKSVARNDERIRAVYMNGSRANPEAPADLLQDYDIVYVVRETTSFLHEPDWIDIFGKRLMLQEPDRLDLAVGIEHDYTRSYGYLMLFTDGNRLDLTLQTVEEMRRTCGEDSQTVPLLDKDFLLAAVSAASDRSYWVRKPTVEGYERNTNNFWWCMQNVAKGLWRREIPYAKGMLDGVVREMLDEMVAWWIGLRGNFQVSPGKMGKYFQRYLTPELWKHYLNTYSIGDVQSIWEAVFTMCGLFRQLSGEVALSFGFDYPKQEEENMTTYLLQLRQLPPQAVAIFEMPEAVEV